MGNSNTKESRGGDSAHRSQHAGHISTLESAHGSSASADRPSGRRNRVSRGEIGGILGLGTNAASGSGAEPPYAQRETRQEREARRLEKERVARIAERERSIREENVDGGFLVTMGTYTGPEDFNKAIVRQLQIERKIAPFWRGLNDVDPQWTEFQIIAAARGLPVPPPDQTPPDDLIPRPLPAESPGDIAPSLANLTVPINGRSQSAASEHSVSNPGSALPSPITGTTPRTSSPFKPRGKALAAVLGSASRNGSTTEIVPREINLPYDPFVNGQPLEVFLYKDATECPICFLSYPPYLNHTRCCDQAICSECFVQIKRPDPHFPEGHNENDPGANPEESAGLLVSEPACCPYCTQPEFGVTYEPPPFRRGLTYGISPPALGSMNTAMSSSSSLNSGNLSPGSPTTGNRRRTQSLSANASNVVLTDRIRPEWATKLQSARAHLARRAAAATALHTAAFLMNREDARPSRRFGRRSTNLSSSSAAGSTPGVGNNEGENGDSGTVTPSTRGQDPASSGGHRRSRLEDLEEMMYMEAVRLSLAAEEERKRKEEKEQRKEAKKREKEERKSAKAVTREPYEGASGRSGQSSASGSSLSLPGFGRKRGNSAASNLRVEASVAGAIATSGQPSSSALDAGAKDKGKAVDRGLQSTPEGSATGATDATKSSTPSASLVSAPRPIPSAHHSAGPSHLRQMSSASSVSSSLLDSQPGSYVGSSQPHDPRASGLSLGSEEGGDNDRDRDPSGSTEPMFNFRSLAEVVGVSLEGENAGRRLSHIEAERVERERGEGGTAGLGSTQDGEGTAPKGDAALVEHVESQQNPNQGAEAADGQAHLFPPTVTITPETPMLVGAGEDSKRLGYETAVEETRQVAQ
ncbi:hypothetical protein QBC39DRAFT_177658 [Podospora conica]|nr:hypothetical protein QBC39DRAFT_177658 [Schizothecium conicum]